MINRFGGDSKIVSSVEVGVIDVLVDDKDGRKCVGCNSRTINEIHRHSETMLLSALRYVDNTRGYSVDGGAPVWANFTGKYKTWKNGIGVTYTTPALAFRFLSA